MVGPTLTGPSNKIDSTWLILLFEAYAIPGRIAKDLQLPRNNSRAIETETPTAEGSYMQEPSEDGQCDHEIYFSHERSQ